MNKVAFLPSLRPVVLSLLALAVVFGATPARVGAQIVVAEVGAGPRLAPTSAVDGDFALTPPMRRARRMVRAGASLLVLGGVSTIASVVVLARLDDSPCASHDPFCDNGWAKGMGALSGMVIGTALLAHGVVTLSVGVARRNRLRRVSDVAVGVGPSRLDFGLRF